MLFMYRDTTQTIPHNNFIIEMKNKTFKTIIIIKHKNWRQMNDTNSWIN